MDDKSIIFVTHMLKNIEKIELFIKGLSKKELERDELKQYAIVRAIEIIGEAAKNLPDSFRNEHPDIKWKEIIGTRDIIIHKYFGIDLNIIWSIVERDLPDLKKKLKKIIKNA